MLTEPGSALSRRLLIALLAGGLALTAFDPSLAQPSRRGGAEKSDAAEQSSEAKRLPADVTTDHTVELAGRTLRFKATAGTIPILNGEGKLQAEIAYMAYLMPDTPARPLTFAFNGGPGAASAYLQIGAMGPWRLPLDNIVPSSTPALMPNAETWLDFTDLVFVDPVGTGYSRFIAGGDEVRKQFWSVDGDIDVLVDLHAQVDREERTAGLEEIHRGRKLWRLPRPETRRQAQRAGRRGQWPGDGLAGDRFRLARQRPPLAVRLDRRGFPRWRRPRARRTRHSTARRCARPSATRPANTCRI